MYVQPYKLATREVIIMLGRQEQQLPSGQKRLCGRIILPERRCAGELLWPLVSCKDPMSIVTARCGK